MIIGQWLAYDSPTPDQFLTAYGFSACNLELRVGADEKVGCAGYQALPVRSIALFVQHVYCTMPSSISTLWTLPGSNWFRAWEHEDATRRSAGALTCRAVGEMVQSNRSC
jgi:hypothetical protein